MRYDSLRSGSLWIVQLGLAGLFLFSGVTKFLMPEAVLVGTSHLPATFYLFIGVCEILGALGLALPGLVRSRLDLTPIAAGALGIVMTGAVGMAVQGYGPGAAILPGVAGLLCGVIAYGRRGWITAPAVRRSPAAAAVRQPSHA